MDTFLAEIIAVCHKHQLWISHEDGHGAFIITDHSTEEWLQDAHLELGDRIGVVVDRDV